MSTNVHVAQRVVIIHVLVHLGPQRVALVVDNVGKTKLDAHNFVDNSSIFIIKKSNYITFPLENDYVDTISFANVKSLI